MQARRSLDPHRISGGGYNRADDREGLIRGYDEEEETGFGLTDLAEDSDENAPLRSPHPNGLANGNGNGKKSFEPPRRPSPRPR